MITVISPRGKLRFKKSASRQEDQQVRGAPAAEAVAHQREGDHRAQKGGHDRRHDADLDAGDEGVADTRDAAEVRPGIQRELVPTEVELALGLVERQRHDYGDRDEQVDQDEDRDDPDEVPPQPAHQTRSSVPARRM
jgi:hypothetical protein